MSSVRQTRDDLDFELESVQPGHADGGDVRIGRLAGENVDCVVRGGVLTDQSVAARHVADLRLRVHAAPAYLEHAGVPTLPAQLREPSHRIVQFRGARSGQGFEYALRRAGETVLLDARCMLAIDDGNAYPANRHVGRKLRVFIDWVVELMEEKQ